MRKLSQAFISATQLSVQETKYFCLLELQSRKCFLKVTFINTSLSNDIVRILTPETELHKLNYNNTVILKSGIIETYCQRVSGPNNTVKNICLIEFAACYTTKTIDQNDYRPSQIPDVITFNRKNTRIYSISSKVSYEKKNLSTCLTILPT